MDKVKRIWDFFKYDTYGNIALASFLVCSVSGVVLAIPYDVNQAYDSISILLIANPAAVFFRNMHYWSAQLFVIFTLLHTWEHVRLSSASQIKDGVWFRLVISFLFVFFVMLSGFILKADADSLQAFRIFESLLGSIPLLGTFLADIILGREDNLQLLYIHHVATATIFLLIIIFEHSRIIWTNKITFLLSLVILSLLAFFIQAPLQDQTDVVLKGPWYFVGLQEMLHYTSNPGWIWLVFVMLFTLFWLLKYSKGRNYKILSKTLAVLGIVYLVLTLIGFYFRGENWQWQWPWEAEDKVSVFPLEVGFQKMNAQYSLLTAQDIPVVQGKREACMICHKDVSGFSPAHDPQAIGCTSCHLGHPFTLDKDLAHKSMVSIPGNLADARQTCGTTQCHPDIPVRVEHSLMTTNSGIVSVDRFVFGENPSPDVLSHITEIGHGAADTHLRNLCSKCHLGSEKSETGSITELSRGGGCLACHLNYSPKGKEQHNDYLASGKDENSLPSMHPSVDLQISNDHCFGCHSRSGRISTNYEGWHETLLDESEVLGDDKYRVLEDQRVFEFVAADVHHTAGLDCIDCHDSYELMGDGNLYMHQEQAVTIRCEDCHFNNDGQTATYSELDDEARKIFDLRKFEHQDLPMVKKQLSGNVLINTFINSQGHFLRSKNTTQLHEMKSPATVCSGNYGHESLSCSACHTAWAPQCIGCHNTYDPDAPGYDLLEMKERQGSWVEYVGKFFAEVPTLGVREGNIKQIIPAIPGMVMTIDVGSFEENDLKGDKPDIFHRLFAPAVPHTTSAIGRNCKSCHTDPLAIGYGRGELVYQIKEGKGSWSFTPEFAPNENDGLADDAWIGFLKETKPNMTVSTRTDFRPFTVKEQKKILTIGACLTCHDENSFEIQNSLNLPFNQYLKQISNSCILPVFSKK